MFHSKLHLLLSVASVLGALHTAQAQYDLYGDLSYGSSVESQLDYVFTDSYYDVICPPGDSPVCATDGRQYQRFSSKCRLDSQNLKLLFAGNPELTQTDLNYCSSYSALAPSPYYLRPQPTHATHYSSISGSNSFAYAAANGPYGAKAVAEAPGPYPVGSSSYPVYSKSAPAYRAFDGVYPKTTAAPARGSTVVTTKATRYPSRYPTAAPTSAPTTPPTPATTDATTDTSTAAPTKTSTTAPTDASTAPPTAAPTDAPTATPTVAPTDASTVAPTATPTDAPTAAPTSAATDSPTATPTAAPTAAPTAISTAAPTDVTTQATTAAPSGDLVITETDGLATTTTTVTPGTIDTCPDTFTTLTIVVNGVTSTVSGCKTVTTS
ncbi:GL22977 [Drosophila persimilis]|uniref:GL22977 n=1 Tax=Drosophila persimilis TaxID=7234 RepID=B4H9T3_DROPE|nr:mucin-5AC [Drosophila persimilis]EDW36580.1 GL22977 [Drosophila persimilis]